ncbi:MAG: hypothetical protein PVSMB8_13170 [Vulcanimicrobiaceae bacterium]
MTRDTLPCPAPSPDDTLPELPHFDESTLDLETLNEDGAIDRFLVRPHETMA